MAALAARVRELEASLNPPAKSGSAAASAASSGPTAVKTETRTGTSRFFRAVSAPTKSKGDTTTTRLPVATPGAPPPVDDDTRKIIAKLGFPEDDIPEAARSMKEHGNGLTMIAPFAAKEIHGTQIYHAAFAAEKFGKESAQRAIRLAVGYYLEGPDLFHAADADRNANPDCSALACELGFRKRDILFAAKALQLWSNLSEGRKAVEKLKQLWAQWKVDIHEEDIRYSATTFKNLDEELLEKALRDRHPKNARENWLRGASIPLIAWAYRLDAPHVGQYIDEANKRNVRRERVGHYVIAVFGRKRGKDIDLPEWL